MIEPGWTCPLPGLGCGNCGNGELEPIESCNDGNQVGGDGCSDDCTVIEPNFQCFEPGTPCEKCGDGVKDPNEVCDDGNTDNGDG